MRGPDNARRPADSHGALIGLERHGGHSPQSVLTPVLQRLLALTAAIGPNHHTGQPVLRSFTASHH